MLNESLLLSSPDELKDLLLHGLTIFHVALVYVLMYVIYKALGRYIYFKPQEHASKINRTFLALSLLIVLIHTLAGFASYLPFPPEYRWLFLLCTLVFLIAPLSILMDWSIWNYRLGERGHREWHYKYLQIPKDYYKTSVIKTERDGNTFRSWEEEVVESTRENIHSDVLLNILALTVFVTVSWQWAHESTMGYGCWPYAFAAIVSLGIGGAFLDRAVFSWVHYLEREGTALFRG